MKAIVDGASDEAKLKLIQDHPDLAGKAALAGEVTPCPYLSPYHPVSSYRLRGIQAELIPPSQARSE
jgi:hypothetical protein